MTRLLRRWFRCRKGQHRETLDLVHLSTAHAFRELVVHDWFFRCTDCGRRRWFAYSDNIDELHRHEGWPS